MECGIREEGGGSQVTGRWLHRGETHTVPAGGSHHVPVHTPQCYYTVWGAPGIKTCKYLQHSCASNDVSTVVCADDDCSRTYENR